MKTSFLIESFRGVQGMQFTLVHDEKVKKFCYWENGICQGMQYENEFYRHVASVKEEHRLKAYELSGNLQEAGASVCMTVSLDGYSVWQGLRTTQEQP